MVRKGNNWKTTVTIVTIFLSCFPMPGYDESWTVTNRHFDRHHPPGRPQPQGAGRSQWLLTEGLEQ